MDHGGLFPECVKRVHMASKFSCSSSSRIWNDLRNLWASLMRSPHLPTRNAHRLFLFVFFGLLAGFLFLSFVFVFFSAFVSHGMTSFLYEIDCLAVKSALNHIDSVTAYFRGFKLSK